MNCKVPWDDEFIFTNFTKKFFAEDLGAHRANTLFERERAQMPATQERIRIMYLHEEIAHLEQSVELYTKIQRPGEAQKYKDLLAARRAELPDGASTSRPSSERNMRARPVCGCVRDECRGFVMNNTWKCGVCSTPVCKDCLKEKTEDHTCTAEDKATRAILLNKTKPCPHCAAMISKVDGCSQMWCVMCHTTFDWNTGEKIMRGSMHNPHYYEWMRRTGQQIPAPEVRLQRPEARPGDCLVPANQFIARIRSAGYYINTVVAKLSYLHRLLGDIEDRIQPMRDRTEAELYENLRFKYLTNAFSEEKYKKELLKLERGKVQKRAETHIADVFHTFVRDKLFHIYENLPRDIEPHLNEISALRDYCNDEFKKTGRAYSSGFYFIVENFSHVFKSR
jgi:hypothetical protein